MSTHARELRTDPGPRLLVEDGLVLWPGGSARGPGVEAALLAGRCAQEVVRHAGRTTRVRSVVWDEDRRVLHDGTERLWPWTVLLPGRRERRVLGVGFARGPKVFLGFSRAGLAPGPGLEGCPADHLWGLADAALVAPPPVAVLWVGGSVEPLSPPPPVTDEAGSVDAGRLRAGELLASGDAWAVAVAVRVGAGVEVVAQDAWSDDAWRWRLSPPPPSLVARRGAPRAGGHPERVAPGA